LSAPYPGVAQELTGDRGEPSTTDVAKDQAGAVAGTASDAGKHVAGVAGEQAGQVASEASQQVKDLVHQTRGELTEQAAAQQKRVAGGLRSLGEELHSMAQNSEQQGPATDLVKQAAERTSKVASWLEDRGPGNVVDEVTRFARQRPGAFLAIAAGAGLLVGRLGRGLKATAVTAAVVTLQPEVRGAPRTSGRGRTAARVTPPSRHPRSRSTHPHPATHNPHPATHSRLLGFSSRLRATGSPPLGTSHLLRGIRRARATPRPRGIRRRLVTGRRRERVLRRAPGAVRGRRPVDRRVVRRGQ